VIARRDELVARTGYCVNPVRLVGTVAHLDRTNGETRLSYSTEHEPGGHLLKACGNRRAGVCPSCAETYRRDAWHMIAGGLKGNPDQDMPASVAEHPTAFVTFTAPTFGQVHSRIVVTDPNGREHVQPCHPRRNAPRCRHGMRLECRLRHRADDRRVGGPLCARCYDYEGAVLWNALAPRLWQRTSIYLYRRIARELNITIKRTGQLIRLSYAKVAEYQRRGLIHYHAVIRIDAATPDSDGQPARPPRVSLYRKRRWKRHKALLEPILPEHPALTDVFTVELLDRAIRQLVPDDEDPDRGVKVKLPPAEGQPERYVRWGPSVDIRPINDDDQAVTAEAVAAYIAKYATKSTEGFSGTGDWLAPGQLPAHAIRMAEAVRSLRPLPHLAGLSFGRQDHALGYGGHWSSKSRRYSTTFARIRTARADHARAQRHGTATPLDAWGRPLDEDQVLVIAHWSYGGRGYRSSSDAALALAAAAYAREHRQAVRGHRDVRPD
jgi:Replication initiator protein, pSAM2